MRNFLFYIISVASLLIISVTSCVKPVSFPPEPKIEYKDFEIQGDSGILSITFTDGDGDIGLNEGDTLGSFSQDNFFHYNLYIEYYELMNGNWVKGTQDPTGNNFPTGDTINFPFRIKNLTPIGQNKTLKGTINVTLESFFYNPLSNHSDSIRYAVTLIDRALNKSNRIITPLIVK